MNRLFCFSYFLTTTKTNELNFFTFYTKIVVNSCKILIQNDRMRRFTAR